MRAYLGPLGAMVRLPYASSVAMSRLRPHTEHLTLGGQMKIQQALHQRRSWTVQIGGLRPNEIGALEELLYVGRPPWVFVEPWAQVTNLLTPAQSVLAERSFVGVGVLAGRVPLGDDGVSMWSLEPSGWIEIGHDTPVEPGTALVASAWVRGSRVLTSLVWRMSDGSLEESKAAVTVARSTPRRVSITGRPKKTAVSVFMRIKDAEVITRPSITWTPQTTQWSMGQGCAQAVVVGLDNQIQTAFRGKNEPRSGAVSFEVIEVGGREYSDAGW